MGGERQLGFFPDYSGKKLLIKNKLADLIESLKNENTDAVVLASGDPLFFGIGGYLVSQFNSADYQIEIYPAVSSLQLAFARATISWQDVQCISLHGRKIQGLAQRVDAKNKVAILTDTENHPGKIAAYLLHFQLTDYRAFVAENLGMEKERCSWYSLEDLAQKNGDDFYELNVVILVRDAKNRANTLGIPDEEFSFPEKPDGLITKKEIRVLAISALNLKPDSVVWDIGSCTGSIAIEAAKTATEGKVYAFEKNPQHAMHCHVNTKKFHTDIEIIEKNAPDGLVDLPDPDAVFIGGSGGNLRDILEVCSRRLRPSGRVVVNAATVETLYEAMDYFKQNGFIAESSMIQISRSRKIGELTRFQALNPVFILTARRGINSRGDS